MDAAYRGILRPDCGTAMPGERPIEEESMGNLRVLSELVTNAIVHAASASVGSISIV